MIKFNREKLFPYILGGSALFVASIAAFFSVMGIGLLFSGATLSAMLMALSLEAGKLSATTFLYRYWNKTSKFLRIYLIAAVLVLMGITSLGIFGWLSSAYQSSSLKYDINQQQLSVMESQKDQLQVQVNISKERIDNLIANRKEQEATNQSIVKSQAILRNPSQLRQIQQQDAEFINKTDMEINNEKVRYTNYLNDVFEYDKKINDAKMDSIKSKDVITFKFVADAFGVNLTKAVKWFIVSIISVFDPLAVSLILAYNVSIFKEEKNVELVEEPVVEKKN